MIARADVDNGRASRAARLLLDARNSGSRLLELSKDVRPRSAAEAYEIQDAVLPQIGHVAGWKVGARTPRAEPTCAPLPAKLILPSPQRFPPGKFALNGVEAELAFTLARDLPPRDVAYEEAEMFAAVERVHPAIEVVDSRFSDIGTTDAWSLLADFQSNGALVLGAGVALPGAFGSGEQTVCLLVNDVEQVATPGRNPAGSLMRLLSWLANHVAIRSGGLRRGDVVTTGSWTGLRFFPAGTRVAAAFPGIGGVELAF